MTNEHEQRRHEMLCAYVLGECSNDERAEVERELEQSPEMRAQRDTIAQTIGLVKDALATPSESLSTEAAANVFSAASAMKPSAWQSVPWLRIAAGVGAVALGAALFHKPEAKTLFESRIDDAQVAGVNERARDAEDARKKSGELVYKSEHKSAERGEFAQPPADKGVVDGAKPEAAADPSVLRFSESPAGTPAPGAEGAPIRGQFSFDFEKNPMAPRPNQQAGESNVDPLAASSSSAIGVGSAGHAQPRAAPTTVERNPLAASSGDVLLVESMRGERDAKLFQERERQDASGRAAGVDNFTTGAQSLPELAKADARGADSPASRTMPGGGGGGSGKKSAPSASGPTGPATGGANAPSSPGAPATSPAPKPAELASGRLKGFGYTGDTSAPAEKRVAELEAKIRRIESQPSGGAQLDLIEAHEELSKLKDGDASFHRYYWQLPASEQQQYLDRECRRILDGCYRRPNERPRDMFFRFWGDNPFEVAAIDALSTFSADVDTASYALARRYLNEGNVPEKAQIRTEEFVNYFKSEVAAPTEGVFAIHTDLTPSRFSTDSSRTMLRVVIRGKELSKVERPRMNLTFVVDVSGSMREQNRLEMVKHSMRLLASQLDPFDKIGIVKFSTDASIVLHPTAVSNRAEIEAAIQPLEPGGSTNSNAGLELGYAIALGVLDPNAINRVVFLSDGVANVGETDPVKISERVKPMREKGIYLNTIGVGMNNHNDVLLEQLANKSDGMCSYIDSPDEAKRALVDNFTGAFQPIARDVKIQVEFDPAQVLRYRLLGYENRAVADADFRNDKIDAGELGAGHQVTALYELERMGPANAEKPLAFVRVRWKDPKNFGTNAEQDVAKELAQPVSASKLATFEGAGQGYRRAVLVAQFAEILRRSIHARGDSLDDLLNEALKLQKELPNDASFTEFVLLVSKSKDVILRTMPACDELCQAIDSVRDLEYRRSQLAQLQKEQDVKFLEEMRRQNDQLEARLRELIRRRLETEGK